MPEGRSMTNDAAAQTSGPAPARMLHAFWGLSLLATMLGVGRHEAEALAELMPDAGTITERFASIPVEAWLFAAAHLVAALASLGMGYLVISLMYPRRFLAGEARSNPAAAIQACAHLLGAALIATVSWGGSDAWSLVVSATFCGLGWAAVVAICALHRLLTRYRDHDEIARGNTAAAIASAGLHLAVAIVVAHAIQGQFSGWASSLAAFAAALIWAAALYPLREIVLARLILGMTPRAIDEAVALRRDAVLAAAEAACYVMTAVCLSAGW
jgi:uncharacterized membrane protein YjfL (UPF0719 family)